MLSLEFVRKVVATTGVWLSGLNTGNSEVVTRRPCHSLQGETRVHADGARKVRLENFLRRTHHCALWPSLKLPDPIPPPSLTTWIQLIVLFGFPNKLKLTIPIAQTFRAEPGFGLFY